MIDNMNKYDLIQGWQGPPTGCPAKKFTYFEAKYLNPKYSSEKYYRL